MSASATTKTKALDALEGMRQVVRHEMLTRGAYVDDEISSPELAKSGAVCGGRKHCAIGSLWAGAGVGLVRDTYGGAYLPGVEEGERGDFLRRRPGLRLAFDSLNAAAESFAKRHDLGLVPDDDPREPFDAPAEELFEGHYGERLTKDDLLRIITSAKRKVAAA